MLQVYPNAGLLEWLDRMLDDDLIYKLFVNDETPHADTILPDLTEASFSGYLAMTVAPADFVIRSVSGNIGTALAPPISFHNGGGSPTNVYGYYVVDPTGLILLGAARFDDAPIAIPADGYQQVTPILANDSLYK